MSQIPINDETGRVPFLILARCGCNRFPHLWQICMMVAIGFLLDCDGLSRFRYNGQHLLAQEKTLFPSAMVFVVADGGLLTEKIFY